MTNRELLRILSESQTLLNKATETEERKRIETSGSELERELAKLSLAATDAHAQASAQVQDLEEIIRNARDGINALMEADRGQEKREDNVVYEQINEAVDNMATAHQTACTEIEHNLGSLGAFNITLFGRTLTGKSTLMEILTRGNGKSIGKGAQRTTRDVREYEWNGMRITDIPGVAAFGGETDEDVAYNAAMQSDLIIFLITDDAPQPSEAEHFARLKKIGNPMLGICNVKRAVGDRVQIKLFLRDQDELFDERRLGDLTDQFNEMAASYGLGIETSFRHAHLQSRFLANQKEYQDLRTELSTASRFSDIEDHIIGEVSRNGRFHRRRSFHESAHRAMFEVWQQMMMAGTSSYAIHDRLSDHVKETKTWREQFQREAQARVQSAINSTIGRLSRDIPTFAEEHCEDEDINRAWQQKVESAGINERIKELQEQLQTRARIKIRTLVEEVGYEFETVQTVFARTTIETGPIRDHRKTWNWSVTGVTSALGVASAAAFFVFPPLALPLGILAGGIALVGKVLGGLLGNKPKRRQEEVSRISPMLQENLSRIEGRLKRDLDKFIRVDLIDTLINGTINTLETIAVSAGQAARFYRDQADALNRKVLDMNWQMVTDALKHAGEYWRALDGATVARAPGQGLAVRPGNNMDLTNDNIMKVQAIVQEPLETIPPHWSDRRVVQWAVDLEEGADEIRIDWDKRTAQVKHANQAPETPARTTMAEQLTGLHIVNTG